MALLAVNIPLIRSRVFIAKLGFLQKVMKADPCSPSERTIFALSEDVDSRCLVKERKQLEEWFGTNFTDDILGRRELPLIQKHVQSHL